MDSQITVKVENIEQIGRAQQVQTVPSVGEMLQSRAKRLPSVGIDSIIPSPIARKVENVPVERRPTITSVGMNITILHRIVLSVEMHTALRHKTALSVGTSRQRRPSSLHRRDWLLAG